MDGAAKGCPRQANGGSIIRDHLGQWFTRFCKNIGRTTSIEVEIWAIRNGLTLANDINLKKLVVEMDAKLAIDLVAKENTTHHRSNNIIVLSEQAGDHQSLPLLPGSRVYHCYREANKCTDLLIGIGNNIDLGIRFFNIVPY
ncbi:putative ribonuclease H protein [Camellia lanceoleosa]|uniref:Ribonuclease H protein n=1 Tax=Camellia lanceoleosa TaxID=1840588 RepID=A0ACC0ITI0_9ERIC|nr:putative ribonuclease H protein [Camellia lanceoleosa]